MVAVTDDVLQRLVEAIVRVADPEAVILFGSRARGGEREQSDVDLLIVEREPFGEQRSRRAETARIRRALRGSCIPMDLLVFSRSEVDYWRESINHVIPRALREGRVLYARPEAGA
jgi:predicted nucleotidyltransferase